MTVINTNYCTIDEAWGGDMGKKEKRKKTNVDPICDLYNNKKMQQNNYNDTDLTRFANEYYDKNRYQRNTSPPKDTFEEIPREKMPKRVTIKPEQAYYKANADNSSLFAKQFEIKLPPLYDSIDGECPEISKSIMNELPSENITNDEITRFVTRTEEYNNSEPIEDELIQQYKQTIQETYKQEEEDEHESEDISPPRRIRNILPEAERIFQEKPQKLSNLMREFDLMKETTSAFQFFDIILYIISGIILIFLLEQFVKIGINMQRV